MEKEMVNFNFVPVVFKDASFQGEKGIIDREKLDRLLVKYNMNIQESGFYLCGPAIMTNGVVKTLKNMGVKKEFIHFEKFSM
jgi:Na+-transporting NADH:ubiquinone oxidoreductase subunit NqrF